MRVFSINFKIVDSAEASIPVMDRGFLYGDSVYEAIRTYRGTIPFLLDRHYERLCRSAARIRLEVPFSLKDLRTHIQECLKDCKNPDSYVRIIVSRGEDNRFDLSPGEHLQPRTVIIVDHVHTYPEAFFQEGISLRLVSVRRNLREALDPNIKSGNYMNNVLAILEAKSFGAVDAVMLNHEGCITEGTTSNVFMVKDGLVLTPPVESGLLEGISRGLLKEIMNREGIRFSEQPISEALFRSADEIFLTGTTKEVMPVTRVNEDPVGNGRPGKLTRRLLTLFQAEVKRLLDGPR